MGSAARSQVLRGTASLGATLIAAILIVAPAAAQGRQPSTTLDWRDCAGGFQCATAHLPRDYARPHGKEVRIAVNRFPAQDESRRIGSLFINPGGPGLSGTAFVRAMVKQLEGDLSLIGLERFDIVGFDPRGVPKSSPAVDCDVNPERLGPLAMPFTTPATLDRKALIARDRRYVRRCVDRNEPILPYVSTANVARDLNRLRAAVGDRKLTYYGGSYGTFLGATYVSMFPRRARAIVLDGAVDPDQYANHPLDLWDESTAGFETALGRFLQACSRDQVACNGFGGDDPWAELDRLLRRLDRSPIPAGDPDPRPVDGDVARIAILEALYSNYNWPDLAAALAQAARGEGTLLRQFADAIYGWEPDGGYAPNGPAFAISAIEQRFPGNRKPYWRAGKRAYRDFDHFWWWGGYSKLVYRAYPIRPRGVFRGPFENPGSSPTTLVVGTTYDPATPYKMARRLVHQLGNARLLTMNGTQHTAGFGDPCIRTAVAAYLNRLELPPKGKVCQQQVPFAARPDAQMTPRKVARRAREPRTPYLPPIVTP